MLPLLSAWCPLQTIAKLRAEVAKLDGDCGSHAQALQLKSATIADLSAEVEALREQVDASNATADSAVSEAAAANAAVEAAEANAAALEDSMRAADAAHAEAQRELMSEIAKEKVRGRRPRSVAAYGGGVPVPHARVSCRVVSCRVVSCRVVSCRVVSCRVVLCLCRVVSCRVVSCRVVTA